MEHDDDRVWPWLVFAPDVRDRDRHRFPRVRARGGPDKATLVLSGVPVVVGLFLAMVGISLLAFSGEAAIILSGVLAMLSGLGALAVPVTVFARWSAAASFERARRAGRVIVPADDLDDRAQEILLPVRDAVRRVQDSRAAREGHTADGLALLREQEWRIACALRELGEARSILAGTGGGLAEQRRALADTEQVISRRAEAVVAYADSVAQLDAALADVDAASQNDLLSHKLRDAVATLGEGESLESLAAESGDARTAVAEALRVLRQQTDVLRTTATEESP
jgi:hypothetical protein